MGERRGRIAAGTLAGLTTGAAAVALVWTATVVAVATGWDPMHMGTTAGIVPDVMAVAPVMLLAATFLGSLLGMLSTAVVPLFRRPEPLRIAAIIAFGVVATLLWAWLGSTIASSYLSFVTPDPILLDVIGTTVLGVLGTVSSTAAAAKPALLLRGVDRRAVLAAAAAVVLGAVAGVVVAVTQPALATAEFGGSSGSWIVVGGGSGGFAFITRAGRAWQTTTGAALGVVVGVLSIAMGRRWAFTVLAAVAGSAAAFVALRTGVQNPVASALPPWWGSGGVIGGFMTATGPATPGVTALVTVAWGLGAAGLGTVSALVLRRRSDPSDCPGE